MNKVSPIILPIVPMNVPPRYSLKSFIDTVDTSIRKRTMNTPSPPLTPVHVPLSPAPAPDPSTSARLTPEIYIIPPPPTPINEEKKIIISISNDKEREIDNDNDNDNDKERESQKEYNYIIVKDDIDCDELGQKISDIRNEPSINLRYDRLNVHDYIYNYILFAYNFYNPIFTMYITIITYKQQMNQSTIFKNIVISYAMIYPLIAMVILLNEAYYIYCKKFIYYKLMDNGAIFKWKKEYLHKSVYFWWYVLSLLFICIGINDSWNVVLMFINQTSNLCIYVYNTINIESTLITLNGFFENNINLQTENMKKIIWIDEDKLKENVYSIIEAKQILQRNMDNEVQLLLSSFMKKDNEEEDVNILIMEDFDKYKHLLHTKTITEYYKVFEKCYPDIGIIGKMKIKRIKKDIIPVELSCHTQFPFYKRKWVLTLLNEMKQNYNIYWNHKCINCDLLRETNYYLCLVCNLYLCEHCDVLNTKKCLKTCYTSLADMDHKTIKVYRNNNNKFISKENKPVYSWYYKLYYHYNLDNLQIINILDTIYYLSIISIFIIEFYGFYIIFS